MRNKAGGTLIFARDHAIALHRTRPKNVPWEGYSLSRAKPGSSYHLLSIIVGAIQYPAMILGTLAA